MILFLGLLLLLGLGGILTATSELKVSANTKLALEAFNVADAGAVHAKQLVTNLRGDFSDVLQGPDGTIRTGDEFTNAGWPAQNATAPYTSGVPIRDGSYQIITYAASCYDASRVGVIAPVTTADTNAFKRALVRIDGRHLYELIAYDDALDSKTYLFDNSVEQQLENAAGTSAANKTSRDFNRRILIRSVGYVTAREIPAFTNGAGGLTTTFNPLADPIATATVDIVVGFNPFPAIVTNEDLTIGGNAIISGTLGAVHANDDLFFNGSSYAISQSATWSDKDDSGGDPTTSRAAGFTGKADRITLPNLNPITYAPKSDVLFVDSAASNADKIALYTALGIWAPQGNSTSTTSKNNFNSQKVHFSNGIDMNGQLVFEFRPNNNKYLIYNLGGSLPPGWDNQDTTDHTGSTSSFGFQRTGSGSWTDNGPGKVQSGKTYYFLQPTNVSNAKVLLNGTGTEASPTIMTVISNTSVDMNGNFVMKPNMKGLQLANQPQWALVDISVLAGMDIRINGGASTNTIAEEGLLYAHEQIDASGNGEVKGQIIAYDQSLVNTSLRDTSGSLVGANTVSGNFILNHEIGQGYLGLFGISAWRELREFRAANAR